MMEREVRQRFTPLVNGILNPHKGCCTFQRFNGDPLYLGQTWIDRRLELPAGMQPGPCEIAIGLVDTDNRPRLRWAVEEHFPDLWTPVGFAVIES